MHTQAHTCAHVHTHTLLHPQTHARVPLHTTHTPEFSDYSLTFLVGFIVWKGFPGGSTGKESSCNAGNLGLISELGRSSGEGKGYPLQCSGLENAMNCIVHGVAKSQTKRLSLSLSKRSQLPPHLIKLEFMPWVSNFERKNGRRNLWFGSVPLPVSSRRLNF